MLKEHRFSHSMGRGINIWVREAKQSAATASRIQRQTAGVVNSIANNMIAFEL
jgi:hypothetical protein